MLVFILPTSSASGVVYMTLTRGGKGCIHVLRKDAWELNFQACLDKYQPCQPYTHPARMWHYRCLSKQSSSKFNNLQSGWANRKRICAERLKSTFSCKSWFSGCRYFMLMKKLKLKGSLFRLFRVLSILLVEKSYFMRKNFLKTSIFSAEYPGGNLDEVLTNHSAGRRGEMEA